MSMHISESREYLPNNGDYMPNLMNNRSAAGKNFKFWRKLSAFEKVLMVALASTRNLYDDMNLNIDPCEDFYEFCCGKFEQKSNLTDDQNYVSKFTIVQEKNKEKLKGMKNEI
ncbi:endothelin-converting enzyme-like protein [Dinothrombium tinctorium]|uniref:Endothelin-converting enzyme-like protein n=1 Tax=Dinothrombium tinctorium TaxID=1965070 RepID=A0A443QEF0_9ACAR|nr:endothelin-converting enzyme-like protein [Dinothrombium tinctorium]